MSLLEKSGSKLHVWNAGEVHHRLIGTITYRLRNGQATSDRTFEDIQLNNGYMKLLLSVEKVVSQLKHTISLNQQIQPTPTFSNISISPTTPHNAFPIPAEVLFPEPQGLWRQHHPSHA